MNDNFWHALRQAQWNTFRRVLPHISSTHPRIFWHAFRMDCSGNEEDGIYENSRVEPVEVSIKKCFVCVYGVFLKKNLYF